MSHGRRFTHHIPIEPSKIRLLRSDHPALEEGRTLFPSMVRHPFKSPRVFVSGKENKKIGGWVSKGRLKGYPIYTLTLEERASCPETCHHWRNCYGNTMPRARRHIHGDALEEQIFYEIDLLDKKYPDGFIIRLHVLGDFYSKRYVTMWGGLLVLYPKLVLFGFTAWPKNSPIGKWIDVFNRAFPDSFFIRFSIKERDANAATTIYDIKDVDRNTIICPAQLDQTDCCGSCGLCWDESFKKKCLGFMFHGMRTGRKKGKKKTVNVFRQHN